MSDRRPGFSMRTRVTAVDGEAAVERTDHLATEEPMEVRLGPRTVAVTMRTPGNDFELACGFLFAEGIVSSADDVARVRYCVDPEVDGEQRYNIVTVDLAPGLDPQLTSLERHFFTTSACGVCGKASLDALNVRGCEPVPPGPVLDRALITSLPGRLRGAQGVFETTGGLHAAGLFDPSGELVAVREDVGRHNALDKIIGWAMLERRTPLHDHVLLLSGRASFELVQKALVAGIGVVCAVSAPSSLAVDVAREFGMTLVGFVREDRFNIYTGAERIRLPAPSGSQGG